MTFPARPADWLTVDEARRRVMAGVRVLPAEPVSIHAADGRALREDVAAPVALPPWDNSAMDGYAVRGADLGGVDDEAAPRLRVVGESLPGAPWQGTLGASESIRIMTGAPVPAGADTVIRVEHTTLLPDGRVRIDRTDDRGRHIRPAGEDMAAGDMVLARGTSIGPGQVAAAASTGHASVLVGARPRVGILTTGDELVGPEQFDRVLSGHAIVDSNGPMLASQTRAAGGLPLLLGPARDSVDDLRTHLARGMSLDVLVTVGGASMGTHDLVKRVLDELGFELDFWRVRIRPGSPLSFGTLPGSGEPVPVFGLPGNPASAFVTFELFVRPFLRAMAGFSRTERRRITATAAEDMRSPEDLTVFLRVVLSRDEGGVVARLTGPQGSGLVRGLASAEGLAVLPEGSGLTRAGEPVDILLLDQA